MNNTDIEVPNPGWKPKPDINRKTCPLKSDWFVDPGTLVEITFRIVLVILLLF